MARSRKPWYRARNIVLALLVLAAAWVGLEVYRALTASPGPLVDYGRATQELIEANQPAGTTPSDPNAMEILEEAFAIASQVGDESRALWTEGVVLDYTMLYSYTSEEQIPRETQEATRALSLRCLEQLRQRGVFDLLERASRTPRAVRRPHVGGPLITIMLPDLGRARNLARANAARMALATRAGDRAELVRAYEHSLALGRILQQQSFIIEHLVGIAITALANSELARDLIERQWDEPTLRACLEALERQRAWTPTLALALEGERLSVLDIIQRTHTDDGRGNGRLIVSAVQSMSGLAGAGATGAGWVDQLMGSRIANLAGIAFASRKAVTREANAYFDGCIRYLNATPRERARMSFQPDAAVEMLSARYHLLRLMLPAFGSCIASARQHELSATGIRVLLALEIHRARHGSYPQSLAALAPEILTEAPRDPFTGGEFGYRVLAPGEDPDGRGFLLYSFGADGEDNGGAGHPKEPVRALRPAGKGLDFVINSPREKPEPAEPEPVPEPATGTATNPVIGG